MLYRSCRCTSSFRCSYFSLLPTSVPLLPADRPKGSCAYSLPPRFSPFAPFLPFLVASRVPFLPRVPRVFDRSTAAHPPLRRDPCPPLSAGSPSFSSTLFIPGLAGALGHAGRIFPLFRSQEGERFGRFLAGSGTDRFEPRGLPALLGGTAEAQAVTRLEEDARRS